MTVLRNGSLVKIASEEVRVGEIIYLVSNDYVPADCVVLSTSNAAGVCYVMTANLDGETSLKTKQSAKATSGIRENLLQHQSAAGDVSQTKPSCDEKQGVVAPLLAGIECENPNPKLDNFLGRMFVFKPDDASDLAKVVSFNHRQFRVD